MQGNPNWLGPAHAFVHQPFQTTSVQQQKQQGTTHVPALFGVSVPSVHSGSPEFSPFQGGFLWRIIGPGSPAVKAWFSVSANPSFHGGLDHERNLGSATLGWHAPGQAHLEHASGQIALRDIGQVHVGSESSAHIETISAEHMFPSNVCFSLATTATVLDTIHLAADSTQEALQWTQCLRQMVQGAQLRAMMYHKQQLTAHAAVNALVIASPGPNIAPSFIDNPAIVAPVRHQLNLDNGTATREMTTLTRENDDVPLNNFTGHMSKMGLTRNSSSSSSDYVSVAFDYCLNNQYEALESLLLERKLEVDAPDSQTRDSLLIMACRMGHCEIAELALRFGASNDPHPYFGQTALQAAVSANQILCARLLLETAHHTGMDTTIVNHCEQATQGGQAPIHVATGTGDSDMLQLLLHHGADVGLLDSAGRTPLHIASSYGNAGGVRLLIDAGADSLVDVVDTSGNVALHAAVLAGSDSVVKILLETAADPAVRNKGGHMPFDLAKRRGNPNCMALLSEYTIPPQQQHQTDATTWRGESDGFGAISASCTLESALDGRFARDDSSSEPVHNTAHNSTPRPTTPFQHVLTKAPDTPTHVTLHHVQQVENWNEPRPGSAFDSHASTTNNDDGSYHTPQNPTQPPLPVTPAMNQVWYRCHSSEGYEYFMHAINHDTTQWEDPRHQDANVSVENWETETERGGTPQQQQQQHPSSSSTSTYHHRHHHHQQQQRHQHQQHLHSHDSSNISNDYGCDCYRCNAHSSAIRPGTGEHEYRTSHLRMYDNDVYSNEDGDAWLERRCSSQDWRGRPNGDRYGNNQYCRRSLQQRYNSDEPRAHHESGEHRHNSVFETSGQYREEDFDGGGGGDSSSVHSAILMRGHGRNRPRSSHGHVHGGGVGLRLRAEIQRIRQASSSSASNSSATNWDAATTWSDFDDGEFSDGATSAGGGVWDDDFDYFSSCSNINNRAIHATAAATARRGNGYASEAIPANARQRMRVRSSSSRGNGEIQRSYGDRSTTADDIRRRAIAGYMTESPRNSNSNSSGGGRRRRAQMTAEERMRPRPPPSTVARGQGRLPSPPPSRGNDFILSRLDDGIGFGGTVDTQFGGEPATTALRRERALSTGDCDHNDDGYDDDREGKEALSPTKSGCETRRRGDGSRVVQESKEALSPTQRRSYSGERDGEGVGVGSSCVVLYDCNNGDDERSATTTRRGSQEINLVENDFVEKTNLTSEMVLLASSAKTAMALATSTEENAKVDRKSGEKVCEPTKDEPTSVVTTATTAEIMAAAPTKNDDKHSALKMMFQQRARAANGIGTEIDSNIVASKDKPTSDGSSDAIEPKESSTITVTTSSVAAAGKKSKLTEEEQLEMRKELEASEKVQKYLKMKRMGLPLGAVLQAMTKESIAAALVIQFKRAFRDLNSIDEDSDDDDSAATNKPKSKRKKKTKKPKKAALTAEDQLTLQESLRGNENTQKFAKMKKMGLPMGAVLQAMTKEGVAPELIAHFKRAFRDLSSAQDEDSDNDGTSGEDDASSVKLQAKEKKSSLKKLHWNAVPRGRLSTSVWATESKDEDDDLGEDDMKELEELFASQPALSAAAATTAVGGHGGPAGSNKGKSKAAKLIRLVDMKRANNVAIALAQFRRIKVPQGVAHALRNARTDILSSHHLSLLENLVPTTTELRIVQDYKGDVALLGKAEQFFLAIGELTHAKKRVQSLLLISQFGGLVDDVLKQASVVVSACKQVLGSERLKTVFGIILRIGNKMNQGTFKGGAAGFTLDSLLKLTETRANDRKTTVVDYLAKTAHKKGGTELLSFAKDLTDIQAASKVAAKEVGQEGFHARERWNQLKQLHQLLSGTGSSSREVVEKLYDGEEDDQQLKNDNIQKTQEAAAAATAESGKPERADPYINILSSFLQESESKLQAMDATIAQMNECCASAARYFAEDPNTCDSKQIFHVLHQFNCHMDVSIAKLRLR